MILLGEHFVVHGTPALAIPAMTVRTRAEVAALPASGCTVDTNSGCEEMAQRLLRAALDQLDLDPARGARVVLRSTIPTGAGLGSSAALAVALVGALARAVGRDLTADDLRRRAHELEKLIHGAPSGVDDAVVANAAPIWFVPGQDPQRLSWPLAGQWRVIAASDGAQRKTRTAVAAVARRRAEAPQRFEELCSQATLVAQEGRRAFDKGDGEQLGQLFDRNQALLEEIGVSTTKTAQLVAAAREAGASGAKITGAGGGGFIIAAVTVAGEERVVAALRAAGARLLLRQPLGAQ